MNNHKKLELLKKNGRFAILAFDHRGSFIKAMEKNSTSPVTTNDAIFLKQAIMEPLMDSMSGALIDEEYGLPALKKIEEKSPTTLPFLLPIEKTGYTDEGGERITVIERYAKDIIEKGATAAKLLLYVNINVPSWNIQMETARKAIEDARSMELPLLLEFVLYTTDQSNVTISSGTVYECVSKALSENVQPDVWKLPYPGSAEECDKITASVGTTPWVILTGGSSFEEFAERYQIAISHGASGFVAGRSLWQEACELYTHPSDLQQFTQKTLVERFKKIQG